MFFETILHKMVAIEPEHQKKKTIEEPKENPISDKQTTLWNSDSKRFYILESCSMLAYIILLVVF